MSAEVPGSAEEAAGALAAAADAGERIRIVGGDTKRGWGPTRDHAVRELSSTRLDRVVEHNAGDLTVVVEAGVSLAGLQEELAKHGQMVALDPPDPGGATIGGVVASGDSGPLRSRYGGPRDLVIGMRLALPDGSVARSGGKVIKNVAGYDLAKLFTGSFGTLGLIAEVTLRLHPRPGRTVTAAAGATEPDALARAALELSRAPLEPLALDIRWGGGDGALLARFTTDEQATRALDSMLEAGLEGSVVEDDAGAWERQRRGQRSDEGAVLRVSGLPSRWPQVLAVATRAGGRVVGRAGLGLAWLTLPDPTPETVGELRRELAPLPCLLLDAPDELHAALGGWQEPDAGAAELARRVKERFDPAGVCG